jgi:hypothetical protein
MYEVEFGLPYRFQFDFYILAEHENEWNFTDETTEPASAALRTSGTIRAAAPHSSDFKINLGSLCATRTTGLIPTERAAQVNRERS